MRHVRSVLYALVLAPAVWILCGVGFTQDLTGRARDAGSVETGIAMLLLILAGAAYAILIFSPISPLGPALFGLIFLGITAWALAAPDAYADVWPAGITKEGFDLSRPGYALAALLAVPMLCTALSARRWSRFEPVQVPLIGTLGRARGTVAAPGSTVASERTAVISTADPTEVMTLSPPMPAPAGQVTPSPLRPSADAQPSGAQEHPAEELTAIVVPAPAPAPADAPTVAVAKADETMAVTKADEPTAVVAGDEPTVPVAGDEPPVSAAADEPTVVAAADEPTAVAATDEPTAVVATDESTVDTAADEPTVVVAPADEPPAGAAAADAAPAEAAGEPTAPLVATEEPKVAVVPDRSEEADGDPTAAVAGGDSPDEPTVFVGNAAGVVDAADENRVDATPVAPDRAGETAGVPSTPFDPAPDATSTDDEPTEMHAHDELPEDEPTRDAAADTTRDVTATGDIARDAETRDVAATDEPTSDVTGEAETRDIAATDEPTRDVAEDGETRDIAATDEPTRDVAEDGETREIAATDEPTRDVTGEAETRDIAATDEPTRDVTADAETRDIAASDEPTRDVTADAGTGSGATAFDEADDDRTQVIRLPAARATPDGADGFRQPDAPGEKTQVIYRRDPANPLPPEEAARARAAAEQAARDKAAQERARQAFRDRAAQERARQAFSERAGAEARDHGEQTRVIDLNAYRGGGQIPGDETQVLPSLPGDQTQRLPWAGLADPGTGTVEPPGDHTQVLSFPVVSRTPDREPRDEEPHDGEPRDRERRDRERRGASILGAEQPDPADDPTTRLGVSMPGERTTAEVGEKRSGSVLDLERPADETADDTRRLVVPPQRRPQEDDEPTTRL